MIINPHAIPTRMTIGQLVECITGKASLYYGGFSDCTAFNNDGSKIKVFGEMLTKAGYHSSGNDILYNGMTGEQLETEIFMGPTYYMRLKHMVKDKINYRARGPTTALSRQPVAGRANDGGLRIGEMERDAVISHGASAFLRESMMERADKYYMAICNTTGTIAIYNPAKNLFMSPSADGPIKFVGSIDNQDVRVEKITKFGRDFSVVCVPYSFKLLLQELQTINVEMRIITEDNIEQLENLSYSKNIEKLTHVDKFVSKTYVQEVNNVLLKANTSKEIITNESPAPSPSPFRVLENPLESPQYISYDLDTDSPFGFPPTPLPGQGSPQEESPTSPDMPPPIPPAVSNDLLSEQAQQYKTSDPVHLRGDTIPNRVWTVFSVGDRMITIDTENLEGLASGENRKVITAAEIYPVGDYSFTAPGQPAPEMTGGYAQQPFNQMGPMMTGGMPAINFNPTFKIMNGGSDFSTEPTASEIVGGGAAPVNNVFGLPQTPTTPPPLMSGGTTENNAEPAKPLDFSSFLIKKLGI